VSDKGRGNRIAAPALRRARHAPTALRNEAGGCRCHGPQRTRCGGRRGGERGRAWHTPTGADMLRVLPLGPGGLLRAGRAGRALAHRRSHGRAQVRRGSAWRCAFAAIAERVVLQLQRVRCALYQQARTDALERGAAVRLVHQARITLVPPALPVVRVRVCARAGVCVPASKRVPLSCSAFSGGFAQWCGISCLARTPARVRTPARIKAGTLWGVAHELAVGV
jgi:hypothetical protein